MADSKVELILTADSRQAVQGIRETQKAADDLNKSVVSGQKEQANAINSIDKALDKIEQDKRKAYNPDQVAKYNKELEKSNQKLDEFNTTGSKVNKTAMTTAKSLASMAAGFFGLSSVIGLVVSEFKKTESGLKTFNTIGAVTRQVLRDLVTEGKFNLANIILSVKANKELETLRVKQRSDLVDIAKAERVYNELMFSSADQTKSNAERLKILNQAMMAHEILMDKKIENAKEELHAIEMGLAAKQTDTDLLNAHAAKLAEIEGMEGERFLSIRRLESQRTGFIQDELNKQRIFEEGLVEEKQKLYEDYYNWYRDQVDKTIKDEAAAKEKAWDEEMEMANWLFKINKHLAEEQAKEAGLLDTESEEGKKNFDSLKRAAGKIVDVYMDMTDRMVEDAERRRQLFDEQIAETQRSLDLELQLMEDGYANNVDVKRREIEELKKMRAEALKNEEEAIRRQRTAESIIQGVNLATSVTQILKEYTKIPLIGIGLAGAAIAALFALFSSAKSKTASLTKLAEGGTGSDTGLITGKSHAAGGEHFLSHVEVERGERWGVLNRKASDKFGRTFDYMVSSFNKGEMPQFSEPEYSNNVTVNNDGSNSRLDKVISEQRKLNKKFNTDQIIMAGQKKIIRNGNKLRIVG